jgi:hypothetical protein
MKADPKPPFCAAINPVQNPRGCLYRHWTLAARRTGTQPPFAAALHERLVWDELTSLHGA